MDGGSGQAQAQVGNRKLLLIRYINADLIPPLSLHSPHSPFFIWAFKELFVGRWQYWQWMWLVAGEGAGNPYNMWMSLFRSMAPHNCFESLFVWLCLWNFLGIDYSDLFSSSEGGSRIYPKLLNRTYVSCCLPDEAGTVLHFHIITYSTRFPHHRHENNNVDPPPHHHLSLLPLLQHKEHIFPLSVCIIGSWPVFANYGFIYSLIVDIIIGLGGKAPLKINTIIILWGLLLSSLSLPCHFIFFSMLLLYKRTLQLLLSVTPTTTLGRFGWQGRKEWKEDATDELIRSIPLQRETHAHSQESPAVEWIWEKM